jgi:hypothetical protein
MSMMIQVRLLIEEARAAKDAALPSGEMAIHLAATNGHVEVGFPSSVWHPVFTLLPDLPPYRT